MTISPCSTPPPYLIALKDGPRDDYYRDNKDHAWQMLRDAIEACKAEGIN